MKNETSLNHEKPPIANELLGEVLSEKQKNGVGLLPTTGCRYVQCG